MKKNIVALSLLVVVVLELLPFKATTAFPNVTNIKYTNEYVYIFHEDDRMSSIDVLRISIFPKKLCLNGEKQEYPLENSELKEGDIVKVTSFFAGCD